MTNITQSGMLLIPDISGYTEFLSNVELSHGRHIIAELLELIINADKLNFEVSEIEGDAILFYRMGSAPSCKELVTQAETTFMKFHQYLKQIERDTICTCGACQHVGNLTLKFVAHYGSMSLTSIKDHVKLIGQDVIIAHRLLKNSLPHSEYLLMTNAFRQASDGELCSTEDVQQSVERYDHVGEITVYVYPLSPLREKVPNPPNPRELSTYPDPIVISKRIQAPMSTIYDLLFDFERMPEWNPGLRKVEYDPELPMRIGMAHNCFFDGATTRVTLARVVNKKDEMVITNRIRIPAPILDSTTTYHLQREGRSVCLTLIFSYKRLAILGWIIDKLFLRNKLRAVFDETCNRLKRIAEETEREV